MTRLVPVFDNPDRQLNLRGRQFHGAMREFLQRSERDTLGLARIGIYTRRGVRRSSGGHNYDQPIRCVRRFFGFQVQQLQETDTEAVQQLITQEGEKLYAFDRIVRILSISGFLFDTDKDVQDPESGQLVRGHHGLSEWKSFYEEARISQIAKSNHLVRIEILGHVLTGAFVNSNVTNGSQDPHRIDLVAQFLCVDVRAPRHRRSILSTITGTDVRGRLTAEGAANAGLLGQLVVDPRPTQLFVSTLPSIETVPGIAVRGTQPSNRQGFQEPASTSRPGEGEFEA